MRHSPIHQKALSIGISSDNTHCEGRACYRRTTCIRYLLHLRDKELRPNIILPYNIKEDSTCKIYWRTKV